jgi:nicotinamide-nucleotide amidase
MLTSLGLTIAVAESCTAGVLGTKLTRVPGASRYFAGGVLCYSNTIKERLCGVSASTLERHGAVSAETAEELARGVRACLRTSLGVSITGIAGPEGGNAEKPVGLVYVGVSNGTRSLHFRRILPGDRDSVRERAAVFAMSSLRGFLLEREQAGGGNP